MNWKKLLIPLIVIIGLGTACITLNNIRTAKNREIAMLEQNYKAARDTLHEVQLKNGQLLAYQEGFILTEQSLREELEMTKDELNDIKSKVGRVDHITKIETRIETDTIYIESEPIVRNDTTYIPMYYSDEWMVLSGVTSLFGNKARTTFTEISIDVPLMVGVSESNKFFATTPNPYVKFNDITGVTNTKSIQKQKHWGVGLNLGPGAYYNPVNKKIDLGVGLQIGINYNF